MEGRYRVGNSGLDVLAGFLGRVCSRFEVPGIVHRVKDTEDINAVFCRVFHKFCHHIIRVMAVP